MDANIVEASSGSTSPTDTTSTDAGAFATSQTEQATGQSAESSTAQESNEPDDSNLPFHEHPRWKQVIEERNTLREQAKIAETLAPFAPLAELARQNGFESFEAMEQARQEMAAQAQVEAQEQETLSGIQQEIDDILSAYREELDEEGHDQKTMEALLKGRQLELVQEASERIAAAHQHAQEHATALQTAKDALRDVPAEMQPGILEIVGLFDPQSVHSVTERIAQLVKSVKASAIVAYEAERAKQDALPVTGSGGTPAVSPTYTATGNIGALMWDRAGANSV